MRPACLSLLAAVETIPEMVFRPQEEREGYWDCSENSVTMRRKNGAAMATEKRAEMAKDKKYKRKWVNWWLVVIVVLCVGAAIWQYASESGNFNAKVESLVEENRQARAELEEMRRKVEELHERIVRDRLSP